MSFKKETAVVIDSKFTEIRIPDTVFVGKTEQKGLGLYAKKDLGKTETVFRTFLFLPTFD